MEIYLSTNEWDFWTLMTWSQGLAKPSPLPSWCPDWNAPRIYIAFRETRAGFAAPSTHEYPEPSVPAQKSWLSADGFKIDNVRRSTVAAPGLTSEPLGSQAEILGRWRWLQECFSLVVAVLRGSESAVTTFTQMMIALPREILFHEDEAVQLQASHACEAWFLCLSDIEVETPQTFDVPTFLAARGRSFFRTSKNRPGLGPPDMRPGDEVVIIPGGGALFILRKTDKLAPEDSIEEMTKMNQ